MMSGSKRGGGRTWIILKELLGIVDQTVPEEVEEVTNSLKDEITAYIAQMGEALSKDELKYYFVDRLGYSANSYHQTISDLRANDVISEYSGYIGFAGGDPGTPPEPGDPGFDYYNGNGA